MRVFYNKKEIKRGVWQGLELAQEWGGGPDNFEHVGAQVGDVLIHALANCLDVLIDNGIGEVYVLL